jgi:hypothetical protein
MQKEEFISFTSNEFDRILSRINYRRRHSGKHLSIIFSTEETEFNLWLNFSDGKLTQQICIPKPRKDENGNTVIGKSAIRSVCSWYITKTSKEVDYWGLMKIILTESVSYYYPKVRGVNKRIFIERLIKSFEIGKSPNISLYLQRLINNIVNELPICGTPMQTWAMNNRVMFIDPNFEAMPPKDVLKYQHKKNLALFPWTSLGLSDSSMVKNYMLKKDLRNYSPFCKKHHNPMRNLYQPLGMKGPERPLVMTRSAKTLEERGVARGGWNWMTCFMDLPLNFEDQIMIHQKHQDKVASSTKKFIAFGNVLVKKGADVSKGEILSIEPGSRALSFTSNCESAQVIDILKEDMPIDGKKHEVKVIIIEIKRSFKEGFKFTNVHGNKGIAVFCETGVVLDPIRNREVDIDIIVGAKTIGNRRNFGQVFEALCTMINGPDKHLIINDDFFCDMNVLKARLEKAGTGPEGTCEIVTKYGKFNTICGWVFWGLLKEPEEALWERKDVTRIDNIGVRKAGNKISHIEFRGLITTFGPKSAITKEILSYQEGQDIVEQFLLVLKSIRGDNIEPRQKISAEDIVVIDQKNGFLHNKESLLKTVSDETVGKEGFLLQLPVTYTTFVSKEWGKQPKEETSEGPAEDREGYKKYSVNSIFIPFSDVREPWKHRCGLWGISEVSIHTNNILRACHAYIDDKNKDTLYDIKVAMRNYINIISTRLSTKKGLIAKHCMSVRYPNSAKATAAQAEHLPSNTIEVHTEMARDLNVKHGDYVLVERFPCLGFMSVRAQKIFVTDDPNCKYVIRVSGSSLSSLSLDFDGDVLYVMSFKTKRANTELQYEFSFPNEHTRKYIEASSNKKTPCFSETNLTKLIRQSLKNNQPPMTYAELTPEVQAMIAKILIGIKLGTGTVVALGYNILRIAEGEVKYSDSETNAGVELILDIVANSTFSSKHSIQKLLAKS